MALRDRKSPQSQWLTTWWRLLPETVFATDDDLEAFLQELGLHDGAIPTAEAFRLGYAKSHRGKFFWHLGKCTRLLKAHQKCQAGQTDVSAN